MTQLKTLVRFAAASFGILVLAAFTSPDRHTPGAQSAKTLNIYAANIFAMSCGECEDGCNVAGCGHSFQSPGAFFDCMPENCHIEWYPNTCATWHDVCIGSLTTPNDPKRVASGVERIGTMIEAGDVVGLSRLLSDHSDALRYNAERQVLQVFSCSGNVVAQFPVNAETNLALN